MVKEEVTEKPFLVNYIGSYMYEKINLLAKSLVSRFSGEKSQESEHPTELSRLQRLQEKRNPTSPRALLQNDERISAHIKNEEAQVAKGLNRWCGDTGRHMRQEIRQGEQLKGAQTTFEIDPLMHRRTWSS